LLLTTSLIKFNSINKVIFHGGTVFLHLPWYQLSLSNLKTTTMAKYSKGAGKKVEEAMHEMKKGELKSGSGKKVTSRKQAIAIGLSEARERGAKVPAKKAATKRAPKKATAKKGAKSATKSSARGTKKAAPRKAATKSGGTRKSASKTTSKSGSKSRSTASKKSASKKSSSK
jgi:hypothetical protein